MTAAGISVFSHVCAQLHRHMLRGEGHSSSAGGGFACGMRCPVVRANCTSRLLRQIGQEGEEESDIFTIREVSFQPTGESDWKDTNYTLNTDSLDWVSAADT